MIEGGREDEAGDVFSIIICCDKCYSRDFVLRNDRLTGKLCKTETLIVRADSMMH